jgi:peptidoglycan hydrolase CwlO-like protein
MFKFLFKLALVVVAAYLLLQIPYFSKIRDEIKASVMEKVQNVQNEATRVQGKIAGAEKTIDDTKKQVTDITDKIKETGKSVGDALTTINKTADALKNSLGNTPTAQPTPTPALSTK